MLGGSFGSFDPWRYQMGLGLRKPSAHAFITSITDSQDALEEELAQLRDKHPDEYALLTEHLDIAAPPREECDG